MSNFAIPYIVGNKLGVHHQYWPVITRDKVLDLLGGVTDANNRFADGTWPVPVTHDLLMLLSWRVREWTVSDVVFTYQGVTSPSFEPIGSTIWILDSITVPTFKLVQMRATPTLHKVAHELDILGPATETLLTGDDPDVNHRPWKTLRNLGITNDPDAPFDPPGATLANLHYDVVAGPENYYMTFDANLNAGYVLFDEMANRFYPTFNFSMSFRPQSEGALVSMYALPTVPHAPALPPPSFGVSEDVQQGTLIINPGGIEVPLGMRGGPGGVSPPIWDAGGFGSCAAVMTATKFWPGRSKTGLPIWDEDTGAQLRSILS